MNHIKVSIIIPVYNVENYLIKCINSALNQTLQEIEVIAVNDGSTDKSLEILKSFSDDRLKIITQENQGLSGARNTAINIAKGEFLLFLDSDDYIDLEMAESMYNKAIENNLDIVICRYNQVDDEGNSLYKSGITNDFSKEDHFKRILSAKSSSMACDKLFKRELFIENNIFFPPNLYHEDVYTIYKLFYFAQSIQVIEEAFYNWLKRDGSISKSVSQKHIDDIEKILLDTKGFLDKAGIFKKYEKEFIRRGVHFLFGLTDRINSSKLSNEQKNSLRINVWKIVKLFELNTENGLKNLKKIDMRLYSKMKLKMDYAKNQKDNVLYLLGNKIFPKGTKRREILKKLLFKDSYEAPKKIKNNTTPMLEVAMPILQSEIEALRTLKDKFKGKRCFIVGNGPSLNKCDLSLLENEYTFGVNGIFYKTEEMGFKPTFYMVEDGHVVDDNLEKINAYDKPRYKFFPSLYKEKIIKTDNTYFFAADLGFYRGNHPSFEIPRFSYDFSEVGYCGQSVTYLNMQLAYYLGFTEVYLIGMDFSYQIRETDEARGATLVSNEDDINHFHPDYFGKGKKWHDPKVHNVAKNYEFAKEQFEKDGRKIYNATIGGKLEIFERVDYNSLLKGEKI